ncbi:hypothetical protein HJG60_008752 [Phyllostomus discolor]|uniref:Uncharacterized protein n=1 Tax=Phyllostomus discolor TaxID=89673 RepID=A0A833YW76_9CHIR|nr:hypothetical protein HJG60_008752 [Phyllostomus discolor]
MLFPGIVLKETKHNPVIILFVFFFLFSATPAGGKRSHVTRLAATGYQVGATAPSWRAVLDKFTGCFSGQFMQRTCLPPDFHWSEPCHLQKFPRSSKQYLPPQHCIGLEVSSAHSTHEMCCRGWSCVCGKLGPLHHGQPRLRQAARHWEAKKISSHT